MRLSVSGDAVDVDLWFPARPALMEPARLAVAHCDGLPEHLSRQPSIQPAPCGRTPLNNVVNHRAHGANQQHDKLAPGCEARE